jgi:ParB-like chromosome segregation protein Spo0J
MVAEGNRHDKSVQQISQDISRDRSVQAIQSHAVTIPIEQVRPGKSPRRVAEDPEHIRILAESASQLPPIIVRSSDLSIIDGAHRFAAQRMRGASTVQALMFEGDDLETYLEAVRRNVYHGKPLTMDERRAAARRILEWNPQLSDRCIAEICGLSAKVVAGLRGGTTAANPRLNTYRIGKDGRARPLDPQSAREEVARLLRQNINASLRDVARRAGTSVNTARNVRRHLLDAEGQISVTPSSQCSEQPPNMPSVANDQVFATSPEGNAFTKWLLSNTIEPSDWHGFVSSIPQSRLYAVIDEANRRADEWTEFAQALSSRIH